MPLTKIRRNPWRTDRTAKVSTEPVASLNADSLISAWEILSFILTWRKTGIIVAGSVGAIAAPSNRAVIKGSPNHIISSDGRNGRHDNNADCSEHEEGNPYLLQDLKFDRSAAVEQDITGAEYSMIWFSADSTVMCKIPDTSGPSRMPAIRNIAHIRDLSFCDRKTERCLRPG